MKKIILILIVLTFTLTLFAQQTIRVRVQSNAAADGTVLLADEFLNIIDSDSNAEFIVGSTNFDFQIAESYAPEILYADAYGGTSWGSWCETGFIQGFDENAYPYPTCHLYMYFEIPVDIIVNVYSNIEVNNALIVLEDQGETYGSTTETLKKGWNEIEFSDIWGELFNVTTCYAEVTAAGVGNESYTLTTTNDFVYNSSTGYYENSDIEFCFDNKPLHDDWNWESLPKLAVNSTTNNDYTNMVPLLQNNIIPGGYEWLDVLGEGDDDLEYSTQYGWFPTTYQIRSSDGFKLKLDNPYPHNRIYDASGIRVLETTTIDLQAGQWNWIGYWLPHSEMSNVAFGDDWSKVSHMKSEDWTYFNNSMIRGSLPGVNDPVSLGPKPLHYGEGYMVYLSEPIYDFSWQTSSEKSQNFDKPEPENFVFEKKADYEVIDVVNIDQSISEIGVFADRVCLGAVVVQDSSEQILVYSDNANRDPVSFTFEIVTGRGFSIPIKDYQIMDLKTGKFESQLIISGNQEYSLIMLGEEGEQEEELPNITKLHNNYPNPFNPTTTISFSVTQNSDFVNLEIFNVKGQKVKTLFSGNAEEGNHTVTWNGDDENDDPVSSGIYFYKLKTGEQELSRKMLLLK